MAHFKTPDRGLNLIPVEFDEQVIPGAFEHALCYLIDNAIDLEHLRNRCHNEVAGGSRTDRTEGGKRGVSAHDPACMYRMAQYHRDRSTVQP